MITVCLLSAPVGADGELQSLEQPSSSYAYNLRVYSADISGLSSINSGSISSDVPFVFAMDRYNIQDENYPSVQVIIQHPDGTINNLFGSEGGYDAEIGGYFSSYYPGTVYRMVYADRGSIEIGTYTAWLSLSDDETYTPISDEVSFTVTASPSDFAGFGTEESPYLIENAEGLVALSQELNNAFDGVYFRQTADIDLSGYTITPIGSARADYYVTDIESLNPDNGMNPNRITVNSKEAGFNGIFDGNFYKISNLHIDSVDSENYSPIGLFSTLGDGAVLRNLNLIDVSLSSSNEVDVGGLVGQIWYGLTDGTILIENCHVSGSIETNYRGGLLAGTIYSPTGSVTIHDCTVSGSVQSGATSENGGQYSGGLSGYLGTGYGEGIISVMRCSVDADVSSIAGGVGGLVGFCTGGSVIDCIVDGSVSTTGDGTVYDTAGGLFGSGLPSTVKNCVVMTDISSSNGTPGCISAGGGFSAQSSVQNIVILSPSVSGNFNGASILGEMVYADPLENIYVLDSIEVTETSVSEDGITEKITLEKAKTQSFYEEIGFDFSVIWELGIDGYPQLKIIVPPSESSSLQEPTLTAPVIDGEYFTGNPLTVSWTHAGDLVPDKYVVQVFQDGVSVGSWDTSSTSYTITADNLIQAGTYSIDVYAEKKGYDSVYSNMIVTLKKSFEITSPAPSQSVPTDTAFTVSWTEAKFTPTGYKLSLRDITNGDDGELLYDHKECGLVTSFEIPANTFVTGHKYRIAVCAYNADVEIWEECEFAAPKIFEILSPSEGTSYSSDKGLTVSWTEVPLAIKYKLSLRDLTPDMPEEEALVYNQIDRELTTSFTIPANKLIAGHSYRVAVGVVRSSGNEIWEEVEFTIKGGQISSSRDIVLLVDVSNGVNLLDLEKVKSSLRAFVSQDLTQNPGSKIAIVTVDSNAELTHDFSSDIYELYSAIDTINVGDSSSDIYSGMIKAAEVCSFNLDASSNTPTSLIIVSPGLPNTGTTTPTSSMLYKHPSLSKHPYIGEGNALVNLIDSSSINDVFDEIYTVQIPTLTIKTNQKDAEFSETLMLSLQNSGYTRLNLDSDIYNLGFLKGDKDIFFNSDLVNGDKLIYHDVYYSDDLFSEDSTKYNHELATISLGLSTAAFSSSATDYSLRTDDTNYDYWDTRFANLEDVYRKLGFDSIDYYGYHSPVSDTENNIDNIAYAIAQKEVVIDGVEKTLISVVVRGSGYGTEWGNNFILDNPDDNEKAIYVDGFAIASKEIYNNLDDNYLSSTTNHENTVIWITGYGRGGAVSNILAGEIDKNLLSLSLQKENVYAYTFASPNCVDTSYAENKNVHTGYNNIYNIVNPSDSLSALPSVLWNYDKFGQNLYFNYRSQDKSILPKITDEYAELTYGRLYAPTDYSVSVAFVGAKVSDIFGDKNKYVTTHQYYLHDFFEALNYDNSVSILSLKSAIESIYGKGSFDAVDDIKNHDQITNDLRYYLKETTMDTILNNDNARNDFALLFMSLFVSVDFDDPETQSSMSELIRDIEILFSIIRPFIDLVTSILSLPVEGDELGEAAHELLLSCDYTLFAMGLEYGEKEGYMTEETFTTVSLVGSSIKEIGSVAIGGVGVGLFVHIADLTIQLIQNIIEINVVNDIADSFIVIGNQNGFSSDKSVNEIYTFKELLDSIVVLSCTGSSVGTVIKQHDAEVYMSWMKVGSEYPESYVFTKTRSIDEFTAMLIPFSIEYNLAGGVNNADNPSTYRYSDEDIVLKEPTRNGWVFEGWVSESSRVPIKEVTIPYGSIGNKIYYAVWSHSIIVNGEIVETNDYDTSISGIIIPKASDGTIAKTTELQEISPNKYSGILNTNYDLYNKNLFIPEDAVILKMYDITVTSTVESNEEMKIYFIVKKSDLPADVSPEKIALYHYTNDGWVKLPTVWEKEKDIAEVYHYYAITDSFSPFAIGYDISPNTVPTPDTNLPTSSNSPVGSSVWLTENIPTQTETPTPIPTPSETAPTDIPTTEPTKTPTSSAPVVGTLLGLLTLGLLLRRRQ